MKSLSLMAAFALLVAHGLAAPAAAETRPAKPKRGDPQEVVCEKQEVLGSRLAVRRVCMTRAQWDEQRRSDRDLVNRSQMTPTVKHAC